jgi:adenine-specific DNA-methyltransferase
MNGESLNITQDQLEKLKSVFPEVVTEGKIDWEKLQATLGKENAEFNNERYVLNWAGKAEAFKVLQQSTTATLKPVPDESINFGATENVFIEGENLEVLKVLQKAYYGKIKCIIIDPPYNTGNDSFIYPDSFKESREEYQKRIGEKDEDGYLMKEGFFRKNSKDSGHYHSNWLSMMYPRLFLAKNLLRDDGVIFVHIDDNEEHNLRLIMNEIFGEENYLGTIVRSTGQTTGQDSGGLGSSFDYVHTYSKNAKVYLSGLELDEHDLKRFENEDELGKYAYDQMRKTGSSDKREDRPNMWYAVEDPDGKLLYPIAPAGYEGRWRFEEKTYKRLKDENYIIWKKSKRGTKEIWWPYVKYYLEGRTKRPSPLWDDLEGNKKAARDLRSLFEGIKLFDFPKPIQLIQRLIQIIPNPEKGDIILDFFAGSATTAQAIIELNKEDIGNRKYILVQLPEICDEESEAFKAGYKTIAEISKERVRRVIKKIEKERVEKPKIFEKGELDLGFKVFKLSSSNFKIWRGSEINKDNLESQLEAFTNPVKEESETDNMLYELILKSGYLLTDKVQFISPTGGGKGGGFYSIKDGELIIALEVITQKLIDKIISAKPKKVITLDKLFTGNDQLKTNTVLQMKDAEIDFKTI